MLSQGLSADIPPVRRIVRILAADLEKSTIPLDSRNMGNIMYGMQKMTMTSRNRQVRELLSSISKAFKMTPYPLSAQAVGNCFYGEENVHDLLLNILSTFAYVHTHTHTHTHTYLSTKILLFSLVSFLSLSLTHIISILQGYRV